MVHLKVPDYRVLVHLSSNEHDKKLLYKYLRFRSECSSWRVQAWSFIFEKLSVPETFSKLIKKVQNANSPLKIYRNVKRTGLMTQFDQL